MKIALTILVLLVVIIFAYFAFLSMSNTTPDTALVDGNLRPCPATPNCVSSETTGEKYIEPLKPADGAEINDLWRKSIEALTEMGGEIEKQEDEFAWVTFKSRLFKFTDDVEIRKDDTVGVIQIRSSSRSGKSDLGVNRKRVEALKARLGKKL